MNAHPFAVFGPGPYKCFAYRESKHQDPGAPARPGTTCDACLTDIMHVFMVRAANGAEFKVGSDCVRKCEDAPLTAEMRALQKAAADAAKAAKRAEAMAARKAAGELGPAARKAAQKAARLASLDALCGAELAQLDEIAVGPSSHAATAADMAAHARAEGWPFSPKQKAYIARMFAERDMVNVPAPVGRVAVRGVVVSVKVDQKVFNGREQTTCKMTVQCAGYRVSSTAPQALLMETFETLHCPEGALERLKGCTVELTATLIRSDRDESLAFADRPSKAKLVAWPADAEKPAPAPRAEVAEANEEPYPEFLAA